MAKWKKWLAAGLGMLLAALPLAGCGSQPDAGTSSQPGGSGAAVGSQTASAPEKPAEPVTITALIAAGTMPPEENPILSAIREASGVNLKVTLTANADYANKKATLAAAHNLPDIISYTSRSELKEMVENDIILPLDSLLAERGKDILENKGDYFGGCRVDGVTYGIPTGGTEAVIPSMMAIRKDWLDQLNLTVPQTVEEFYEVMKAFTKNDPNGNGTADTIGFGMGPNNLRDGVFQAFGIGTLYNVEVDAAAVASTLTKYGVNEALITELESAADENGSISVPDLLNPNYMEAIEYFRRLYAEGLMEPDFAVIPWMQCLEKLWNGTYGAFSFSPAGTTNNWMTRYTEDPKPEFVYSILKSGVSGGGVEIPQIDSFGVTINTKCEHPDAAMDLLNFICTEEGNDLCILGIEGTHYKDNGDGTISYLPPYDEDLSLQRKEGGLVYHMVDRINGAALKTFNKVTTDAIAYGLGAPLANTVQLPDAPQILTDTGTILTDMQKEAFAALVVANGDPGAEYKSYVEKFCQSGGTDWVKQATELHAAAD